MSARVRRAVTLLLLAWLVPSQGALADGTLPPRPYRYLHPPKALARGNQPPLPGSRTLPVKRGLNTQGFTLFTKDGQAAMGTNAGGLRVGSRDRTMAVNIRAINLPAPLPHKYQLDGNAYSMTAMGLPGKDGARAVKRVGIVLRWPHLPHAILVYTGKQWHVVCDTSSKDWQVNPLIVFCHASTLGIFVAARRVFK